ncbi:hypothetical protein ACN2C6_10600 [Caulobacter sp. ErkDOM-YI]|uniref:hypothetical protein n=1 Tax=unclassified Caulobacter TaxID=2648921 RepID=UPI003AF77270
MVTTSKPLKALLAMTSAAVLLSACASADDVAALRQPAMPPVAIAKAAQHKPFFRNVSLQAVEGAPEFRWFDGGAIITTRPTRVQVVENLTRHLDRADLLARSRLDSEYMLYVRFDELRGPSLWLGTDKLASARVTFRLVRWRTGELVRESTVETSYRAAWTGFTPEMTRAALGGPLLASKDAVLAPVGGALKGLALGYYVNQNLVVSIADAPYAGLVGALEASRIGGPSHAPAGFAAAFAAAAAVGSASGRFTDLEAMLAGGVITAAGAAAGPTPVARPVSADGEVTTAVAGRARRLAATRGLMDLAFDQFMAELSEDGSVNYKTAVSCAALNGFSGKGPYLRENASSYAVDCPGSSYNESKTQQVYPSRF